MVRNCEDRSGIMKNNQILTYSRWERNRNLPYHTKQRIENRCNQKKSKLKRIDSQVPNINMSGLSQILNESNSWFKRFAWFIVLLLFGGFCTYQLTQCFINYFSFPTNLQTEVIHNGKITFPTLVICPGFLRNIQYQFYHENNSCPDEDTFCFLSDPYVKTVVKYYPPFNTKPPIEIHKFWSSFAIDESEISVYVPCATNTSASGECTSLGKKLNHKFASGHSAVATFWGSCGVIESSDELDYQGPSLTFIKVVYTNDVYGNVIDDLKKQLNNTSDPQQIKSINESLHKQKISLLISGFASNKKNRNHLSFYRSFEVYQGFETHVQLQKKQFIYKNKINKPCVSDDDWIKCYNNCIEKNMTQLCSMPYYTHKHLPRNCNWDTEFLNSHLKNSVAYSTFSFSACNCSSVCNETVYSITLDAVSKLYNQSNTLFKVYFADQTFERTTERYSYKFGSCLSDIGGNLGFFLGISVLTGFEILEQILYYVTKRWIRK